MCVQFRISRKEKIAVLALAPIWLPLALCGGLAYVVFKASSRAVSSASGKLSRHHDKSKAQKEDEAAVRDGAVEPSVDKARLRAALAVLNTPNDKNAWCAAGMMRYLLGEFDSAIALWDRARREGAIDWTEVHVYHALALFSVGRVEDGFDVVLSCAGDYDASLPYVSRQVRRADPNFSAPPHRLVNLVLFGALYSGAIALPAGKDGRVLAMLEEAGRCLQHVEDPAYKRALLDYAQAVLVGERTVAAVRADAQRQALLASALTNLDAATDARKRDVAQLRAMIHAFDAGVVTADEGSLFENRESMRRYRRRRVGGHDLQPHFFKSPHFCDDCGLFIRQITGVQCSLCGVSIHSGCGAAAAAANECIVFDDATGAQHHRNGVFEARRELLLVWKRSQPTLPRDVVKIISAKIDQ